MNNLSVRAFDEAQRRKQYPDRRGIVGVACIQRDILSTGKHLAILSDVLWKTSIDTRHQGDLISNEATSNNSVMVQQHLTSAGILLLQISGALGMDFVALLKHGIEKEEMTVL